MNHQEFFRRYTYNLQKDKLGGGTFGTVYKAYDNVLDKTVAVKIAEVKTFGDKSFSLLDEFEAVKGLPPHVNIAHYNEVFTFEQPTGTFDFAIIQYYPHGNLSDLIKNEELTQSQKEDISLQILEGLRFLHEHKVVHRDMKPSNILIHKRISGKIIAKIADFGLSKRANTVAQSRFTNSFGGGTLEYSSPEQLRGETLRFNTDLWAWAVITYELFTGKKLFAPTSNHSVGSAEREKELFEQILSKELQVSLSELPQNWQNALLQCFERNPESRIRCAEKIRAIIDGKKAEVDSDEIFIHIDEETEIIDAPNKEIVEKPQNHSAANEEKYGVNTSPTHKNRNVLYIGIVALLFLIVAISIWLYRQYTQHFPEEHAWEELTQNVDADADDYTNFLTVYPDGKYREKANIKIKDLQDEANRSIRDDKLKALNIEDKQSTKKVEEVTKSNNKTGAIENTITLKDGNKYTGKLKNNIPHGEGTIYFQYDQVISQHDPKRTKAVPGDYIQGKWNNGELELGTLYDKNNKRKGRIIIGRYK